MNRLIRKGLLLSSLVFICVCELTGQSLYFPPLTGDNWETVEPESLGWCESSLEEMYDYLESNGTKSFLILKDGKIVIEKYFGDHNRGKQWTWFSAGKSLRAFLVGIAQQDGMLNINDKTSDYLGLGWTGTNQSSEDLITVRSQLTMTSGLDERFFDCITPSCLLKRADAGERWIYHNGPYNLLKEVLESATAMNINSYTDLKVKSAIGMQTGTWLENGLNTFFVSTARDMARFGLLIQNEGIWDNQVILNDAVYYKEMINSSQELNPAYGYLWWLNGKSSYIAPSSPISLDGPIAPNAPEDLITAAGAQGQFISLSKSEGLMMIRQGLSSERDLAALPLIDEIWSRINSFDDGDCQTVTSTITAESEKILCYPNPANNYIQLSGINKNDQFSISIIDISGKVILKTDTSLHINTSDIPAGNYIMKAITNGNLTTHRLVIQ
ncbi:MAG: serine hydrolase [Bacteroidota bacterium]